jgi:CRISPR-associated endoribonuclease Cas6
LENKGAVLPFHHQGVIKEVLNNHAERHEIAFDQITFSGLKGQTKISKQGLRYTSKYVTLVLSSRNRALLETLTFSLFDQEVVELGDLILIPEWVEAEAQPKIEKTMSYLCISPMIPYVPHKNSIDNLGVIDPNDREFELSLIRSLSRRMRDNGSFTAEEVDQVNQMRFDPDQKYLDKLSNNNKKFARAYHLQLPDREIICDGYTFPFSLTASEKIHRYLFQTGLGHFPEYGFGMIDLANRQLPRKRLFHISDIIEGRVINPLRQREMVQT